jgi:hypothetical protein
MRHISAPLLAYWKKLLLELEAEIDLNNFDRELSLKIDGCNVMIEKLKEQVHEPHA